jgi:SAM-dependent methyltransferase
MEDDVEALLAGQIAYYRAHAPDDDIAYLDNDWDQSIEELPITGDVLELACGTGHWIPLLAARARSVTALDAAPEALALARRRVQGLPTTAGNAGERFVPDQATPAVWRPLRDGSEHRVVKAYYEPGELAARLAELGWSAEIRETSSPLLVGTARRTIDPERHYGQARQEGRTRPAPKEVSSVSMINARDHSDHWLARRHKLDSFDISGISQRLVPFVQVGGGGSLTWATGGRDGRI